ncbi:DUF1488 family protein [Alkalimonas amylolytica]|uniref:DUF1488 domain-containing protein n=1 Tax=Alkalimonas amylolytica TaxID=152573 RepID=A0A1H4D061_ALKAM|nr:DUF1488 family protein [Alkalimonas amylolytica]SEA65971.1 Protein of unknown function [Alkalimonas amylolytica]
MNQQLIFNHDFYYDSARDAVGFSCLQAGLRLTAFIARPDNTLPADWLAKIKADAFDWEDAAEQAVAAEGWNAAGEFWLPVTG